MFNTYLSKALSPDPGPCSEDRPKSLSVHECNYRESDMGDVANYFQLYSCSLYYKK